MKVIHAENVNEALSEGLRRLFKHGILEASRNGDVIVMPTPVTTVYHRPMERVLFCPMRDANPFFHLMEGLWMLAGREDLEFPRYFNSRFVEYSDDGVTLSGAYGYRWRNYFGCDQIERVVKELKCNPESRRAVIAMWDPSGDLLRMENGSKDIPCNTNIYFRINEGELEMTVCCRSNDIYWGAYGANAVHMSMLQEYIAAAIDRPVGTYYQISNNYHLYTSIVKMDTMLERSRSAHDHNLYAHDVQPMPLCSGDEAPRFMRDLAIFMANPLGKNQNRFLDGVARPMCTAWHERKSGLGDGLATVKDIAANDWNIACRAWIERRIK